MSSISSKSLKIEKNEINIKFRLFHTIKLSFTYIKYDFNIFKRYFSLKKDQKIWQWVSENMKT